ncbi:hypothetical protein [Sandarakinorhabdus sp. AAP62]|uniref:hypothetical protein n=1 Tax=Sandarakinorhabdus sp. AAP62 TaxID=1248916 RepID=UPI0003630F25|nr:hypothetical protein [Sandarakinorhabdus sp. AAP62]
MKNALIAILLCGVAIAACDANRKEKLEEGTTAEIALENSEENSSDGGKGELNIKADMESGEVELKLPGGLAGKVKIPEGMEPDAKFDLDGLGRYPGAKLVNVDVQASGKDDDGRGQVVLGFTAPGTATQVADWYAKALAADGRPASRSGNTLTGTTDDGDRMVIAVDEGTAGVARGRITITDRKG